MRTLIFGCKGQLGRDLMELFQQCGETDGVDLPEVDIAEGQAAAQKVAVFRPDLVINSAAYTNVEGAEEDEAEAFRVNETGAGLVARAAASLHVPVVYYSTDYVFDGEATSPYTPDHAIAPIGAYARSKAAGEIATRRANPRHFILRTAWLYGIGGNNFVEKMMRAALSGAGRTEAPSGSCPSLRVVQDEVGSPTYTRDLAEATAALARTDVYGTYHAVNAGACSRYEFARKIFCLAGVSTPVEPCRSAEFPTKARRPLYSILSNEKLHAHTGHVMRPWEDALAAYLERRRMCA